MQNQGELYQTIQYLSMSGDYKQIFYMPASENAVNNYR